MICPKCCKETYSIFITREDGEICGECMDKKRKKMRKKKDKKYK